jgi:hypothetical protein
VDEGRRAITEKDGVHKEWFQRARDMTVEGLPAFIQELTTAYQHDYGTICHAISAAAIAAAWAVEKSPVGGISGFQANCIMWGFITHWMSKEGKPMALVDYEDMLYPQMRDQFTTISSETWSHLKQMAADNLAKDSEHTHPNVVEHWEGIVRGEVPFGYTVRE